MSRTTAAGTARNQGFSLLEVVVALGVLTLGIASAISLYAAATAAHKRALNRMHAAAMAEYAFADLESALARGADPLALQETPPFEALRRDFPGYDLELQFLVPETGGDLLLAELTIHWMQRGQPHAELFRQFIAREVRVR